MIQDIYPSKFNNSYIDRKASAKDPLFIFNEEGKVLLKDMEGTISFPKGSEFEEGDSVYLFSIDDTGYFLKRGGCVLPEGERSYSYYSIRDVRDKFSGAEVFAVFTAYHLWRWYADNIYCGKCRAELVPDHRERALRCPDCGNIIYPRINPAVIVGVINGDSLLITRYRTGYAHNALVAGFTEIGETLEETVAREVMEETGIRVKNIRYYKSQPWGMAQDILAGFFCEAEGDCKIRMDEGELRYAQWVKRQDIELQPNSLSLTNEMMKSFKEGREK